MQGKNDFSVGQELRAFVRTDDFKTISGEKYTEYKCSPAMHMNLDNQAESRTDYKESGYLSTFEFDANSGLKAVCDYLNYAYIHFIFIPKALGQEIYLNGGTSGFEKRDEITYPLKEDGSAWSIFNRNHFIPQIFNTQTMSVALKPGDFRSKCEVLLGGNWQDYAVCVSLPRAEALNIMRKKHPNEVELFNDLKEHGLYYPVSRDMRKKHSNEVEFLNDLKEHGLYDTVPRDLEDYNAILDLGLIAKQLQEWWHKLQTPERQLLCFLYAVHRQSSYIEPVAEHDFAMLAHLYYVFTIMEQLTVSNSSIREYFYLLKDTMVLTETALVRHDPQNYNKVLNNLLVSKLKRALSGEMNHLEIAQEIENLKLLNDVLKAEAGFWQCIEQRDPREYLPQDILRKKDEVIALIKNSYEGNSLSRESVISKLQTIIPITEVMQKEKQDFLNKNYILNCGLQLLSNSGFSKAKGKSYIYFLGEWFNAWTQRAKELFPLSSQNLHELAKNCETTKNYIITLQKLYEQVSDNSFSEPIATKRFLDVFNKQVESTFLEIKAALEQENSLDIGLFIHQKTKMLIQLIATQVGTKSTIFNSSSVREILNDLEQLHVKESQLNVSRAMG